MSKKKRNILLDLDQTLISAEACDEFDIKTCKSKFKKFEDDKGVYDMDGYYKVFCRPHLQPFLDFLFKNFNVSIWTAASKDYALYIIQEIMLNGHPERKLDFIFFSYHCDLSKKHKNSSKDLSMLWDIYKLKGYNKENTVIFDDYIEDVHKNQPQHCIIASPFEFTEKNSDTDDFLLRLIPILEDDLIVKMDEKGNSHLAKGVNKLMKTL